MVTGCVQAELTPKLVSDLKSFPGIGRPEVIVVATRPALKFFNTAKIERLTEHKVFVDHEDGTVEFPVPHINLPEWADAIFVYPASANTIAKCAHGLADSLASNIVLAAKRPVFFGPTMNKAMYENPVTQHNLRLLKKAGYVLLPRKMCRVTVKATGQVEERLFCPESMVLAMCLKLFRHSP